MQPVQARMARAALNWSVEMLAGKVGLPADDVTRIEQGTEPENEVVDRLRAAFEAAGVAWVGDDGVRLPGAGADAAVTVDELTTANDGGVS